MQLLFGSYAAAFLMNGHEKISTFLVVAWLAGRPGNRGKTVERRRSAKKEASEKENRVERCRAVSGRSYCFLSLSVLNCDLQKIKREEKYTGE